MRELELFAGGGGGILGGYLLGWKTVCAVEIENYPRQVLLARQRDGFLPAFPIWDDITTFDGKLWAGRCDIITGGFPCQDISCAGKRAGIDGPKSGLWKEMARVVWEVRPEFVFVENSAGLFSPIRKYGRWIGPPGVTTIFRDLAEMGYYARWGVLGAENVGAPHERKRAWILAHTSRKPRKEQKSSRWKERNRTGNQSENVSYPYSQRCEKRNKQNQIKIKTRRSGPYRGNIEWWNIDPADLPDTYQQHANMGGYGTNEIRQQKQTKIPGCEIPYTTDQRLQNRTKEETHQEAKEFKRPLRDSENWPVESRVGRVANGIPHRVDRLKTIGNAQVPAVAALAFLILSEGLI